MKKVKKKSETSVKKPLISVKKWQTSEKSNTDMKKCHKLVWKSRRKWQTSEKSDKKSRAS